MLPAYEPLRLAEEIAILDQLTHGRLDVGVGRGVSPYELAYFGVNAGQARARYAETLDLVTRALATGRMTHTGTLLRDYDVELSVGPVQRPHPPLWYASSNTGTAEWAGAHDVNFVGRWNGGAFVPAARTYWQAWEDRPGAATARRPRLGIAANVYIGATDGAAMERFRKANDVFAHQLTKLWHRPTATTRLTRSTTPTAPSPTAIPWSARPRRSAICSSNGSGRRRSTTSRPPWPSAT